VKVPDDRGAATAEAALVLPLLVVLTLALVWLLSLATAQVRLVDAARETARAVARGDPDAAAIERAHVAAPGSTVTLTRTGQDVTVSVTATVRGPGGLLARIPGAELQATAISALEPGVAPP
jgi:Flp pilus assembly protein TadG